jgi:hypothetical protein
VVRLFQMICETRVHGFLIIVWISNFIWVLDRALGGYPIGPCISVIIFWTRSNIGMTQIDGLSLKFFSIKNDYIK